MKNARRFFPDRDSATLLVPFVIAFAVVALRILTLLTPTIWFDEIHTFVVSGFQTPRLIELASMDSHPPLYFLLVRAVRVFIETYAPALRTINVLRIVSLLPGIALCFAAMQWVRQSSTRESGLWTAALFAVSPSLVFYSVELRNYGPAQCTLFIATYFLVRFFANATRSRWLNAVGYTFFAAVSLYLQNLSILYLLAHGLLYIDEIRRSTTRGPLLAWGAVVVTAIGLIYAPWIPRLLAQNQFQNTATFYTLRAMDIPYTYLLYLPFGGLVRDVRPPQPLSWVLMGSMLLLGVSICWSVRIAMRGRKDAARADATGDQPDRLLRYSLVLATGPVVLAFLLTWFDVAKVFMPYRYNQLATPFFLLVLVRALHLAPKFARHAILGAFVALCIPITLYTQLQRIVIANTSICLHEHPAISDFQAPGHLYWTNSRMNPWLDRIADFRFESPEKALADSETLPENIWFITQSYIQSKGGRYSTSETSAFEKALNDNPQIRATDIEKCLGWERLWKVPREQVPVVRERLGEMHAFWQKQRDSISGGQLHLPGDAPFENGTGWAPATILDDLRLTGWTLGDKQSAQWIGPENPGRYRIEVNFWRNNPFPSEQIEVQCRWPGQSDFQTYSAGMGGTMLSSEIVIHDSYEPIRLQMRVPTFNPSECIEGSLDDRPLGVELLSVSLIPLGPPEP